MTNQDYWQTIVGEQSPEEFLRAYGTADPELGLERFLEDRGQLYGVINQGSWKTTFLAKKQYTILTAQVYLRSYLEETREDWQPALEAQPPKVVRRYRPVYDFPVPGSAPEKSGGNGKEEAPPEQVSKNTVDTSAENSTDAPAPDVSNGDSSLDTPSEEAQATEPENTDTEDKSEAAPEAGQPVVEPETEQSVAEPEAEQRFVEPEAAQPVADPETEQPAVAPEATP